MHADVDMYVGINVRADGGANVYVGVIVGVYEGTLMLM